MKNKLALSFLLICAAISLSACESMKRAGHKISQSMQSVHQSVSGENRPEPLQAGVALLAATPKECPRVKALKDLVSVTHFRDPSRPSADSLVATSRLDTIDVRCEKSDGAIVLDLGLNFTGLLGKAGIADLDGQANYTYPYFVTVLTPEGQILSKDVFALSITYENNQMQVHRRDELRQTIPVARGQNPSQFQVIIGFQLSDSELAYNRRMP